MPGSQASESPVDSGHCDMELDGWPARPVSYFTAHLAAGQRGRYQVCLSGEDGKPGKTQCGSHRLDMPVLRVFRLSVSEVVEFCNKQAVAGIACGELKSMLRSVFRIHQLPTQPPAGTQQGPAISGLYSLL